MRKAFKMSSFKAFKCLVDKVVIRRVQLTIRAKYKGIPSHSTFKIVVGPFIVKECNGPLLARNNPIPTKNEPMKITTAESLIHQINMVRDNTLP